MKHRAIGVLLIIGVLFACSKKLGEKDYYDLANQYMAKEDWKQAEAYFEKIVQEFPNGMYTSKALFMVGFINANYLNNYDKAREYYQKFIDRYPNHELADDAKYELENMGKNIDDLPFLKDETLQEGQAKVDETTQ
ncbi:MAG: tetratricopeptide repeat protein [Calditrichaeota bacterium]|nr:tetratricopeptide repeat protein [Calditrichota bacterium]